MKRLRLAVKKENALRFLSHLDFARTVRYIIIRAGIPICYSEGFNPHMKISFASALGVGVAADIEYMDMELTEEIPTAEVIRRMNEKSSQGFAVLKGVYVDEKAPKLMAMANYAVYDLSGPLSENMNQEELNTLLETFNQKDNIIYERCSPKTHRKRMIDVKEHVVEPITGTIVGDTVSIRIGILQNENGAIKPGQVWEVLCNQFAMKATADMMLARRIGIFHRAEGICYSLFDVSDT
ncbi:MAG: TIGR03936 family radical SAM-associated protein [Megasphaera sp.]|jgi:radical SAM-linked protein|nr:TIGR03936 family radical SAM-associated protein [Megasphaera sp.]MCI1823810.1 TIGR03936 family radical SAM-associated protein [Megasphaera sp.]